LRNPSRNVVDDAQLMPLIRLWRGKMNGVHALNRL
jgi:hypothetical protein